MELGKRERQIMSFVYKNGPSTSAEVMEGISNAPSYSGVRAMLRILEEKGYLEHAKDGSKYVYSATQSADEAGRAAMSYLVNAFFGGSTEQAVAALLDVNGTKILDGDLERLTALIQEAKDAGR